LTCVEWNPAKVRLRKGEDGQPHNVRISILQS
jgi:hypothetical protein